MTEPVLVLSEAPTDADETVIASGFADHGTQKISYRDWRPLAALLRDPQTGATLGGMIGKTSFGLLFIDLVHLPETTLGADLDSRVLAMMEQEGLARGCRSAFLFTLVHQTKDFYEGRGWTEFGRINCDPPGTVRVFLTKTLQQPEG